MKTSTQLKSTIHRCLNIIQKNQQSAGSFASTAFSSEISHIRQTSFSTSLILSALRTVDLPEVTDIVKHGIKFLLSEKSDRWSFGYWGRQSTEAKQFPCPDDFDDTSLALSVIHHFKPDLIDEKAFATILSTLIEHETTEGGPYYTWMIGHDTDDAWQEVDIVVNSNIAYFLAGYDITLEPLTAYVEECIRTGNYASKYYSPLTAIYSISKWYKGEHTKELQEAVLNLRNKSGRWNTTLETALATSSLIRLGAEQATYEKALAWLAVQTQFEIEGFFIEQIVGGVPFYSGSVALTAACVAEALSLSLAQKNIVQKKEKVDPAVGRVQKIALARFEHLPKAFSEQATLFMNKLASADRHHEIPLTPVLFARGLAPQNSELQKTSERMGAINILGWLGYTVIDDIIDGEARIPYLSLATVCMREVDTFFQSILPPQHFSIISALLDDIQSANMWEQQSCKCSITDNILSLPATLPSYGTDKVLAQKSIGHAAGPMALCLLSKKHGLTVAGQTRKFFEHFLIARQLNDDAHDWWEDLEHGMLNSVSTFVIKRWQQNNVNIKNKITMADDRESLHYCLWHECIDDISARIIKHVTKAKKILDELPIGTERTYFHDRLDALARAARLAIDERNSTAEFIAAVDQSFVQRH